MASFLGVSKSALCDLEKGRHQVSPLMAAKSAGTCGLSSALAVSLALQDQVSRTGLKMNVVVQAA